MESPGAMLYGLLPTEEPGHGLLRFSPWPSTTPTRVVVDVNTTTCIDGGQSKVFPHAVYAQGGPSIVAKLRILTEDERLNVGSLLQVLQQEAIPCVTRKMGLKHLTEGYGATEVTLDNKTIGIWSILQRYECTLDFLATRILDKTKIAGRPALRKCFGRGLAYQLVEGLVECLDIGISLNDIKPNNVMWDAKNGLLRYIDMGMSFTTNSHAGSMERGGYLLGLRMGTPGYAAPETRDGRYHVSSDLYAAIRTLVKMFRALGLDMTDFIENEAIDQLLVRCLMEDPDARPKPHDVMQLMLSHGYDVDANSLSDIISQLSVDIPGSVTPAPGVVGHKFTPSLVIPHITSNFKITPSELHKNETDNRNMGNGANRNASDDQETSEEETLAWIKQRYSHAAKYQFDEPQPASPFKVPAPRQRSSPAAKLSTSSPLQANPLLSRTISPPLPQPSYPVRQEHLPKPRSTPAPNPIFDLREDSHNKNQSASFMYPPRQPDPPLTTTGSPTSAPSAAGAPSSNVPEGSPGASYELASNNGAPSPTNSQHRQMPTSAHEMPNEHERTTTSSSVLGSRPPLQVAQNGIRSPKLDGNTRKRTREQFQDGVPSSKIFLPSPGISVPKPRPQIDRERLSTRVMEEYNDLKVKRAAKTKEELSEVAYHVYHTYQPGSLNRESVSRIIMEWAKDDVSRQEIHTEAVVRAIIKAIKNLTKGSETTL